MSDTLYDIARRCEEADGPDEYLDADIDLITWADRDTDTTPFFTDCLDDAVSLVPTGYEWETGSGCWARLRPSDTLDQLDPRVVLVRKAATPALALCAAALKARALAPTLIRKTETGNTDSAREWRDKAPKDTA